MKRVWVLGCLASLGLWAIQAHALPARDYSRQESTRCSYAQGCPRMVRNAVAHAEQFCREDGGAMTGGSKRDFSCEQRGIYCVVRGRIECRGRLNPAKVPEHSGLQWPAGSPRKDRSRTCFDPDCNRFVSHGPGHQEEGTHACPFGYLVVGVASVGNDLICEEFSKPVRETVLQKGLERRGVLACPVGMAVRGVSENRDALLCARVEADFDGERVQDESKTQGLQSCADPGLETGAARFVTGLDGERVQLMCTSITPR